MTEKSPSLRESTDQPALQSPGSTAKTVKDAIDVDIAKAGYKKSDIYACIYGITSKDGAMAPCFLKEEQFMDADAIKVYPYEEFWPLYEYYVKEFFYQPEVARRCVFGAFPKFLNCANDKPEYVHWDPAVGPRTIQGFI